MSTADRRISLATIRMEVHGRERAFTVPAPQGPSRLVDLLPATGEIASQEAQANVELARAEGREISCKAGCGACCRQIVVISVVEAQGLSDVVARMTPERQAVIRERFAQGIRRLEAAGLLDAADPKGARYPIARNLGSLRATLDDLGQRYFALGIACPFLEEESCGIYEFRPAVCRQYHVTSPAENCQRPYQNVPIDRLEAAFHVSQLLGDLAEKAAGIEQNTMMLIQALEAAEVHRDVLEATGDGASLFGILMQEMGRLAEKTLPDHG